MTPTAFPARIHVLLARRAPVGVVIRRGPSKRVCTVLWDRTADAFRLGQWLHGRVYERRSDVSPDGTHLIYFAMDGHWDGEAGGSWTAISRVPYLKALTLLAKGDCWHGGGLFTGGGRYWLNDGCGHASIRESHEVVRDLKYQPDRHFGGECPGVYYARLLRDGWTLIRREAIGRWKAMSVFEKPAPGGWTLRKLAHEEVGAPPGKGCYWDEHELDGPGGRISCPDWEWAEVDGDRLAWAAAGKLFGGRPGEGGIAASAELHDFNGMEFEAIAAPY
ncbi:hypothetical protein OJF2_43480 [Aquisphaera giovannonii]|uniref:Uncharacterized protein n=1 Tax=Aquisphaera giovannonii TaxID=406548 RepID=A0A5B9W700_9BACT|nr:hypothetical protein [Aquisphaera giovannonii]QEH35791.1 hypothetical protein OJF2_43480 [Aquisphaera giovannonii]